MENAFNKSDWVGSKVVIFIVVTFLFSGCAMDLAHVSQTPTQLTPMVNSSETFTLTKGVELTETPCGYDRLLYPYSKWELVGTIPEGNVYKSQEQILTVECSHVFEAYLVMNRDTLVGFYLPVEEAYVAASDPVKLPLE